LLGVYASCALRISRPQYASGRGWGPGRICLPTWREVYYLPALSTRNPPEQCQKLTSRGRLSPVNAWV